MEDNETNFDICILCQKKTNTSIVNKPETDSIDKLLTAVKKRFDFNDAAVIKIRERLMDYSSM